MPLENPYRHGAYHYTLATLILMGINKAHKFSAFAGRLQKVWQKGDAEGWRDFKNRKARNEATAKDVGGRILQNCRVLQRVKNNSYGSPLLKAGAVIDLTRDTAGVLHVSLNTHSKKPQKPGRAPAPPKPKLEPKPAKSKPKMSKKPSKGRKRAQKPTVTVPASNQTAVNAQKGVKAAATEESAKSE